VGKLVEHARLTIKEIKGENNLNEQGTSTKSHY